MSKAYNTNFFKYSLTNKYLWSIITRMRYTFQDFKKEFPDDDACLNAVFENRFGDLRFCPKCAAETKFYRVTRRQCFACQWCGHQLHPLADTIFRKSRTSLWSWFYAIYLFSTSKNGVSAKELERHLGVTYKTAWRMAAQIRKLMEQDNDKLSGEVEIDETFIGGKHKQSQKFDKKSSVFGAVERHGLVKAKHVRSTGSRVLLPEIAASVAVNSAIFSDEWTAYKTLKKRGYTHTTVNHSSLEYVRGNAHTNTIEGFWSQLKRSLDGTYHAVSPKYLQSYVDEFVFRYNYRDVAVCPLLLERATMPF